jgi:hypothetical protein
MSGPHRLWPERPVSPLRRARIARDLTLAEQAAEVPCSLSALHALECYGAGSRALRVRVAAALGVTVAEIGDDRAAKGEDPRQLALADSSCTPTVGADSR